MHEIGTVAVVGRLHLVVLGGAVLRHWRWRGILTDYLVASPCVMKGKNEYVGDDSMDNSTP